jgi:hypothetical protein
LPFPDPVELEDWPAARTETELRSLVEERARRIRHRRRLPAALVAAAVVGVIAGAVTRSPRPTPTTVQVIPATDAGAGAPFQQTELKAATLTTQASKPPVPSTATTAKPAPTTETSAVTGDLKVTGSASTTRLASPKTEATSKDPGSVSTTTSPLGTTKTAEPQGVVTQSVSPGGAIVVKAGGCASGIATATLDGSVLASDSVWAPGYYGFSVPLPKTIALGDYTVKVTCTGTDGAPKVDEYPVRVVAPLPPVPVLGAPSQTTAGRNEAVKGGGFPGGAEVIVTFDGTPIGTFTADGNGGFYGTVAIPATATAGSHLMEAKGAGQTAVATVITA